MVTPSNKHTAVSNSTFEERASTTSSAKMHARILQAELLYLRETGFVPADLEQLLSGLMSSSPNRPVKIPPPPIKHKTPAHIILDPPLSYPVKDGVLGGDYRHIVASLGDRVVVFAWTEKCTEAIAYNPRNQLIGLISAAVLQITDSKPFLDTKLYMPTTSIKTIDHVGLVKWKAGDYIRVWDRVEGKHRTSVGLGFNISTGAIGKFTTYFDFKEII